MGTLPDASTATSRTTARAGRVLWLGALAMLLVSAALGGTGVGIGGPSGWALRTHVLSGSLGWMALGALAVALGPANGDETDEAGPAAVTRAGPYLALITVAAIAALVAADSTGSAAVSAGANSAALAAIVALLGWQWTVTRHPGARWTVPRLGIAAAVGVLVTGYAIGTAAAWMTVTGDAGAAANLAAAQSAAIAVPFVVLAATATVEWASAARSTGAAHVTTAGLVQVGAFALAAAATIGGVLTSNLAITEANIPLLLGGIAIFSFRVGPALLAAGWVHSSRIWLVTSVFAMAVDAGLFANVVFEVGAKRYATAGLVPRWLVFSVDHLTFVGVGTTALLGAIAAHFGQAERWPAADLFCAAGLVLGLAGTALGLGVGSAALERASAAVLGLSVLAAVATAGLRITDTYQPIRRRH